MLDLASTEQRICGIKWSQLLQPCLVQWRLQGGARGAPAPPNLLGPPLAPHLSLANVDENVHISGYKFQKFSQTPLPGVWISMK